MTNLSKTRLAVAGLSAMIATAAAAELPVPALSTVRGPAEVVTAARTYAAFWNTGDPALAHAALSPDFIDRTLPEGRPQGVAGPIAASAALPAPPCRISRRRSKT